MALGVAAAAQVAGCGDLYQLWSDGDHVLGEGMVQIHSALGIIAYITMLLSRRAEPCSQGVDFTHGIVTALTGCLPQVIRRLAYLC
jgi:hypothetical protein